MTGKARRFRHDRSASPETGAAEPEVDESTTEPSADDLPGSAEDPAGSAEDTVDRSDAEADGSTDPSHRTPDATPEPSDAAASDTAPRPRAPRRGTPAASAASRARRIGGVRTGAAAAGPEDEPVTAKTGRVSTTKTPARPAPRKAGAAPTARTASAKALKDEARGTPTGGVTVITQVPGWLRWMPAAVLTACAIAMAVVLAVTSHGVWWSKPSVQASRDQVLAAAKQCTALTNTYTYTTIPADEKRGKACTTGAQTQRYVNAMETIVKPTAPKLKASQTVQINTAGVESISPNGSQWTVVIFGQTTIKQTGASARVDPFSSVVRMDHVHGKWLISSICLITAPNGTQAASC